MICSLLLAAIVACHLGDASVLKFEPEDGLKREGVEPTQTATGAHWALIVAGSNGYDNYRHQSDACHAFQIMKKNGIPEENIVLMMYDDIANNEENPTPGVVINHPNGPNVYDGIKIDYKGTTVTPGNFLSILSGDSEKMKGIGTGKVIKSGPNDHVFVNFVDHGAPGILAFPDDVLNAKDLIKTIKDMYTDKKYGQMVFYIEACESGSMFENLLPSNVNVYATTAANAEESSYACYYDAKYSTYLGDVYSVNWMEDTDKEDLKLETLHKQFEIVKDETNTSHVMEYGDKKISNEDVSDFQAGPNYQRSKPTVLPKVPYDAVPSEEVPLAILYHKLSAANDEQSQLKLRKQIDDLLEERSRVLQTVKDIVGTASSDIHQSDRILTTRSKLTSFDCYQPVIELFRRRCFDFIKNDYARKQLKLFVNMCEEQIAVETIMEAIVKVCKA
jgi:legumain